MFGDVMLSAFAAWYWQQMMGLLPPGLRSRDDGPADALIVVTRSQEPPLIELVGRRRRHETSLGSFDPEGADARAAGRAVAAYRARVTLLRLPPYAPELNPIERVWLYLREKHLSHRLLNDYDAIVEALCKAWRKLDKDRLKSLTSYPYVKQIRT